jgi:hypothetical protein
MLCISIVSQGVKVLYRVSNIYSMHILIDDYTYVGLYQ